MSRENGMDGWLGIDRRTLMQGAGAAGLAAAIFGGSASAQTGDARGPYRNNRFLLEIDGVAKAGFRRAEIPGATISEIEYREGNDRPTTRKLKGLDGFEPLVLQSGVTDDSIELFEWFELAQQDLDDARSNIAVILLSPSGDSGARWEFRDAWPGRYEGPDLDATGNGVAVETLEIHHEGMERTA